MPYPLVNDPVVRSNSFLDDAEVVRFTTDDDLAPVSHLVAVDDVDVPRRSISKTLRNGERLVRRPLVRKAPLFRWRSEPTGFAKSARNGMLPFSLLKSALIAVEVRLDRRDLAELVEIGSVRQQELDFQFNLVLIQVSEYSKQLASSAFRSGSLLQAAGIHRRFCLFLNQSGRRMRTRGDAQASIETHRPAIDN